MLPPPAPISISSIDRQAERQAAALLEARGCGRLRARGVRCGWPRVDQAELGGGAAHVEGQDVVPADLAGEERRAHRAGRRA